MSYKIMSRKIIIIVLVLFFVLSSTRIYLNYTQNQNSIKHFIFEQSKLINSLYMTHRNYYQSLYLNKIIKLDEHTLKGLPAYSSKEISKTFSDDNNIHVKLQTVSDRARNPKNQADKFELQAINYFNNNKNANEYFNEENTFYQYATPLKIEQKCLKCHGKKEDAPSFISQKYDKAYDYKLGELRGVLSIKIPTQHVNEVFNKQFYASLIYDFILICIALTIAFFSMRFFGALHVKLANELNDRTDELQNSLSNLQSYKDAIDKNLIVTKTDLDGNITYANDNFLKNTGYSHDEIIGQNHRILKDSSNSKAFYKNMWDTITSKKNMARTNKKY